MIYKTEDNLMRSQPKKEITYLLQNPALERIPPKVNKIKAGSLKKKNRIKRFTKIHTKVTIEHNS